MTHGCRITARTTHTVAFATVAELETGRPMTDTAEYRASRLAARRAVQAMVPLARQVEVERRRGAAPLVSSGRGPGEQELSLSLTHRDGLAAAMVAPAPARIGIDLEREHAIAADHARYFLSARERDSLGTLSLSTMWALKEAAWKALSLNDDVAFHGLELHIDSLGELRAVSARGECFAARATLTSPWPGYVLATVRVEAGR